jgi:cation transport regulator ChaB
MPYDKIDDLSRNIRYNLPKHAENLQRSIEQCLG